ncbi:MULTISPECIES: zinc-ribbon domain-containing protein [Acinetobacter]|uniref:zinc-ribbon domain-containing protein n=1 Tax=Acinetobacter TaxID=469 RepID=UPI00051BE96C|nr:MULTISPECIES: zinc ribbon domain-containing protein [Acinetobacter]
MTCRNCGHLNIDSSQFCSNCGTKINQQNNKTYLWNPSAITNWSILCTPIFGSILYLKNSEALGNKDNIAKSNKWLAISLIVLCLSLFVIYSDFNNDLQSSISGANGLGLVYLFIWYFFFAKEQINQTKNLDYQKKSWIIPLILGISFRLIIFLSASYFASLHQLN